MKHLHLLLAARRLCAAVAWLVLASHATAAPQIPINDEVVLATVRPRAADGGHRRELQQLQQQPTNLALAVAVARQAIERARRDGDPRELGAAQAALAPWWKLADAPPAVRLLRATVRQSQHAFEAALAELEALVADARVPPALRAQAELSAASVLQVLGRYGAAREHCARLAGPAYAALGGAALPAQVCLAELDSLRGQVTAADARLAALAAQASAAEAGWLALVRAELAERRGDGRAGALYRSALAAGAADVYTLAAYADWLLTNDEPAAVLELLAGREAADALLLRLAIAQQRLRDPAAEASRRALHQRFDAARLRGDSLHAREEARLALDIDRDAARALALAQAQWAQQKEPADALLLVRAARTAAQPKAAEPVWQLMRDSGYQDARLRAAANS